MSLQLSVRYSSCSLPFPRNYHILTYSPVLIHQMCWW